MKAKHNLLSIARTIFRKSLSNSIVFALISIILFCPIPVAYAAEPIIVDGVAFIEERGYHFTVVSLPEGEKYSGTVKIPTDLWINGNYEGNVVAIGAGAFRGCAELDSVILGNYVTEIRDSAFMGCTRLVDVKLPETLTTMGKSVFEDCDALQPFTLPSAVVTCGVRLFAGCDGFTEYSLPMDLSVMNVDSLFYNCKGLRKIDLSNLKDIKQGMLVGCDSLEEISTLQLAPDHIFTGTKFFPENVSQRITLKVPPGSKKAYEAADKWKEFANIEEDSIGFHTIRVSNGNRGQLEFVNFENKGDHLLKNVSYQYTYGDRKSVKYDAIEINRSSTDTLFLYKDYSGTLLIHTDSGYDVESVTCNSEDVTDRLTTRKIEYLFYLNGTKVGTTYTYCLELKIDSITGPLDVDVKYTDAFHSVSVTATGNGYVTLSTDLFGREEKPFARDTTITKNFTLNHSAYIYAFPDTGYTCGSVEINGQVARYGGPTNILVKGNDSIKVKFVPTNYAETVRVNDHGALYINGNKLMGDTTYNISQGDILNFEMVPDEGYKPGFLVFNTENLTDSLVNNKYSYQFDVADMNLYHFGNGVINIYAGFRKIEKYTPLEKSDDCFYISYDSETLTATVDSLYNITYSITPGTITRPMSLSSKYADIVIPATIELEGTTYTITKIREHCFQNSNIKSVEIPGTVTEIGGYAFSDCKNLETVTFKGDGLVTIGDYAFNGCSDLHEIAIPSTVRQIGPFAFQCCRSITEVTIPEGITELWQGCFNYCSQLKKVNLPQSLISVYSGCFGECLSLESIKYPDNVRSLGQYVHLLNTALGTVTFGKHMSDNTSGIGVFAFQNCENIDTIYSRKPTRPAFYWDYNFSIEDKVYENCIVKVPVNRRKAYYDQGMVWGKFKHIEEDSICGVYYDVRVKNGDYGIAIANGDSITAGGEYMIECYETGMPVTIEVIPDYGYQSTMAINGEPVGVESGPEITFSWLKSTTPYIDIEIGYEELWHDLSVEVSGAGEITFDSELVSDSVAVYHMRHGVTPLIYFYPDDDMVVTKYTINGVNMIKELSTGYRHRLAAVESETKIEIEFGEYTGIEEINESRITVTAENGLIIVRNAEGENAVVYNAMGMVVSRVDISSPVEYIEVSKQQMYVVKVGGRTSKVIP